MRRSIAGVLLPAFGPGILRLLSASWKLERLGLEDPADWFAQPGRMTTLWHGRMLLGLPAHKNMNLRVLVSPSADGTLSTSMLERFGFDVIHGSSNKNPVAAVRGMLGDLRAGGSIVITPDGPRGPRHSMNSGPAWMASETGSPIMPCGFACDRAWHASSWDHFTIPKPGAHVVIVYGEPLYVEPGADQAAIKAATAELKRRMLDAERRGFEHLGLEPDW